MKLERKYKLLTKAYFGCVYSVCRAASHNSDGHLDSLIHVYAMHLKSLVRARANVLMKIMEKGRSCDFAKVYSDACRNVMLEQFTREGIDYSYYYSL